jgi:hypothetical protein
MTSSSSNEDTNITENSTTAQQDSGQISAAGQGYTDNSKTKARKQQEQQPQQENEQPANQE